LIFPLTVPAQNSTPPLVCGLSVTEVIFAVGAGGQGVEAGDGCEVCAAAGAGRETVFEGSDGGFDPSGPDGAGATGADAVVEAVVGDRGVTREVASVAARPHADSPSRSRVVPTSPDRRTAIMLPRGNGLGVEPGRVRNGLGGSGGTWQGEGNRGGRCGSSNR